MKKSASKGKEKEKKPKVKAEAGSMKGSKDPLEQEEIKDFLLHCNREFRVYLTLENAWPRLTDDGRVQKHEAPVEVMERVIKRNRKYQTPEFRETYDRLFDNIAMRDKMTKSVSALSLLI